LPLFSFLLVFLWFSHTQQLIMATSRAHEKGLGGDDSVLPQSPQLSSTNGSDLDDNYVLYKQQMGDAPADAAEAKGVLRKIDWRVLPVLWTLYLLQYLDKNGLNYVRFFCFSFIIAAIAAVDRSFHGSIADFHIRILG
jgi:hypothetical protein